MYDRGLFHPWVPKPAMLLIIIWYMLVYTLVNPFYNGNIGLMVSSTGIMSEYFVWAMYASSIGMGIAIPLVMRFKMRFRSKEIMIATLLLLSIFTCTIATTDSPVVIVAASFLFGFVKLFGMLEMILPVMFIVSPKGVKAQFYSVFYPIAIILSQAGSYYAAIYSSTTNWQTMHFYAAGVMLFTVLLSVVCMHNKRFARKMPLYYVDWLGALLFSISTLSLAYVFSFGKQQDWFISTSIKAALLISVITLIMVIVRSGKLKRPYLSFKLYRNGNVQSGLILLLAQGMFMSASSLQTIFTSAILGYNWQTNASLFLMSLPGMIMAGFFSQYWTKNNLPIKMLIFIGFAAYFLYTVMLYFMMVPQLNIERWFIPQLLNGFGMCILFISVWIYALQKVPQDEMLVSVGSIMIFRSFFSMALFSALIGWFQYKFQWQSVNNLAFYFDGVVLNMQMALTNYKDLQLNAIMAANKTVLGYIILAGFAILTYIMIHQFGSMKYKIAQYRVKKSFDKRLTDRNPEKDVQTNAESIAGGVL